VLEAEEVEASAVVEEEVEVAFASAFSAGIPAMQ